MDDKARLFFQQLVTTPGVSGFEQPVQRIVRQYAASFAQQLDTDLHGNLILSANSSAETRIMLAGHADQIGLIISHIDEDGYLTILGREKRFANISGEMVSFAILEELINKIKGNESLSAAISVLDGNNEEQIMLFTTIKDLTRAEIVNKAKELGFSELYIPQIIVFIKEIPILVSGKIDYLKVSEFGQEYMQKNLPSMK